MGLGVQPSGRALAELRRVLSLMSSTAKGEKEERKTREERWREREGKYPVSVISGILYQKVNNVQINVKGELR